MSETKLAKKSLFIKFLDWVEVVGNKLPHPALLFGILAIITMLVSHVMYLSEVFVTYQRFNSATNEATDITVYATSLLTRDGIAWMFSRAVANYTGFAPLGTVLVSMLGIGVAEHVGLISALLRKVMLGAPKSLVTLIIVFAGILSSIASDVGYLVIIPLGAAIFYAIGRHPLAGLAAAFFGVSGGYTANIVLTPIDILLAGISQEAARMIDPAATVLPTSNFYIFFVSTFLLSATGYFITEKIIIPKLGPYHKESGEMIDAGIATDLSAAEKKGLKFAGIFFLVFLAGILALLLPPSAPLRNADTGSIVVGSPFIAGFVAIIMLSFIIPSIGFGIGAGTIKSSKDVIKGMVHAMSSMGTYMVMAFFASQFISFFSYSQLGVILSVSGANFLKSVGLTGVPLILAFIAVCAFINLFLGSSSAKWVIMAPIFIPMFMQLGYSPAFTQAVYRIGETPTNLITPLMSYFALVVVFAEKYDKKTGIGTIISLMLPYSIIALIVWAIQMVVWYLLGLPLGLGGAITL